uniref:Uncharacterized protein LOC116296592 isoform X2 n=1 Tax=Actinia tenebrosa TaxID=6105 RepID=A0A6P8I662_ACTTE
MVVKKCPDCDQTLPVACKSCHCGHVFISRKQIMSAQDKSDNGDGSQRDQRLRPEVPKREIKDFDYDFGSKTNPLSLEAGPSQEKPNPTKVLILENHSYSTVGNTVDGAARSYITIPQPMSNERKRGRPKGSKNKPKPVVQPGEEGPENEQSLLNGSQNTDGDTSKRKRGRPKGSKNKPKDPLLLKSAKGSQGTDGWSSDQPDDSYPEPPLDAMPHISKEKAISYSIVLSDINQKMMKQSSMNFV